LLSHVSGWVLLGNGNVQYKQFPKTDATLSNWKSSNLDLSAPLERRHNQLFLLNGCTIHYPKYSNTHCFRSATFTSVPAQVGRHCQFSTFRYNIIHTWSHVTLMTTNPVEISLLIRGHTVNDELFILW